MLSLRRCWPMLPKDQRVRVAQKSAKARCVGEFFPNTRIRIARQMYALQAKLEIIAYSIGR